MSVWKLKINGVESTLQTLGVQQFNLQFMNLGEDTLNITQRPGQLNAAPILAYGDEVQLIEYEDGQVEWNDAETWNDSEAWVDGAPAAGTIRFIGTCTSNPRIGMPGKTEIRKYSCSNIIWELNNIYYEQDWHTDPDNTSYKGRVKIGKNVEDVRINLDAALLDIVGFAQTAGLSFSVNYAGLTAIPPDSEFLNITCFEAIKNLLQWAPSVATSVDYSSGTPAINFVKREVATSAEYTATEMRSLAVTPLNHLLLNGVVISYEIGNQVDGETWVITQQDSAGTITGSRVLKQTIDLYGRESSSSEQSVEVVVEDPGTAASVAFWETYYPGLAAVTDLAVSLATDSVDLGAHPNRLVSGQIMDWMEEDWVEGEFAAQLSFTYNGKKYENVPAFQRMILTTATTKKYTQVTSATYTPPEDIPVGLAASILSQRNQLHYEGQFAFIGQEPDWTGTTSKVCNIQPGGTAASWDDSEAWDDTLQWLETIDGFTGFDAINAVINTISITCTPSACATAIQIGPPKHLGPQDFIAMARASRSRVQSVYSRKEPTSADTGAIASSGVTNADNSSLFGSGLPAASEVAVLVYNPAEGTEEWQVLNKGTDKQVLSVSGTSIVWQDVPDQIKLPATTEGDLLIKGDTGWTKVAHDGGGYVLESTATGAIWQPRIWELPDGTQGDLLVKGAEDWGVEPIGESGYHLVSTGASIEWAAPANDLPDGAQGDLLVKGAEDWGVEPIGESGYHLVSTGASIEWAAPTLPGGDPDDLLKKGTTGWEAVTLANALGLGTAGGVLTWDGSSFGINTFLETITVDSYGYCKA